MRLALTLLICSLPFLACGDEGGVVVADGQCSLDALPIQGGTNAPTLSSVRLEVQTGERIVLFVTAEDDQGVAGFGDVAQEVGVFPDAGCEGVPIVIQDQLDCSGCEQSFGPVVESSADPELFGDMAASSEWPVEVTLEDVDGNITTGQVEAAVSD